VEGAGSDVLAALSTLLLLAGLGHGCAMAMTQDLGVTGLWIDPNPHTGDVPKGALKRADNVVLRRKGTAEPRPGFKAGATFTLARMFGLLPFDNGYLGVGEGLETNTTIWSTGVAVTDGSEAEGDNVLSWSRDAIRACAARENLYLTTSDTPRKVSNVGDVHAPRIGLHRPLCSARLGAAGSAIGSNKRVAYRVVIRSTDVHGLIVRSAPSARAIVNNTGSATLGSVRVYLSEDQISEFAAGMTVEIYRTLNVTNTVVSPPDELYLAREYELTTADVAAGLVVLDDSTLDADLGAALYTNSSREGIERENVRPPLATDLALYAGSMFASNVTYPHRLFLRVTEAGGPIFTATGVGTRGYDGTRTNGSNQITGMSGTTGLQVGQALSIRTDWSGSSADVVRITAIAGSTLTMSATWNGATDGAPASMSFVDTIRIHDGSADKYYPIPSLSDFLQSLLLDDALRGTVANRKLYGYAIGDGITYTGIGLTYGNRRAIVLETLKPTGAQFSVWATHGDEYEPPLPLPTVATGEPSVQDRYQNGVTWSKADQPEHFMRGARWLVGRQDVPVLRSLVAGDALWLLKGKGDGVFRLSGFGERSGWRVDQRSADTYLLHPNLATVLGDAVYAWTNKGAVEISDRGIIPLSASPLGSVFADLQIVLDHKATAPGAFAVANEKDDEVIFGLPPDDFATDENDGRATRIYVLNTENRAWSRWFTDLAYENQFSCAMYDPSTRLLTFGRGADGGTRVERGPSESFVRNADVERTVTINTIVTETRTITIASGSGWTPAEGDLLRSGGSYGIVTSVTSSTVFVVHDTTGLTTGAGKTAYEHYDAALEWLTKTGGAPSALKRFNEVVTHWEDTFGIYTWSMDFEPLMYGALTTSSYTRTYARNAEAEQDSRKHVPRDAALGSRLGLTLNISQADARWRVSGLTVEMEAAGARIAR
jgi:hypothetical protein